MKITRGKVKKPILALIYGVDKVGKTTFASQSPNPVFIGPEAGNNNMDVARFETPKTFQEILDQSESLLKMTSEDIQTVVYDSLDWIEQLLFKDLTERFKVPAIEDVGGGYGKWVSITLQEWKKLIDVTSRLRESGKNIIFIAHYQIKTFNDPITNAGYDRYIMKLNDKAGAIFREFVDTMLFATFEVSVKTDRANDKKGRATGDGIRVAYTERRPSHDAGNRFGLPVELPLDYQSLVNAIEASTVSDVEIIKKEIQSLCDEITDQELLKKINESMVGADAQKLVVIKNRILTIRSRK